MNKEFLMCLMFAIGLIVGSIATQTDLAKRCNNDGKWIGWFTHAVCIKAKK